MRAAAPWCRRCACVIARCVRRHRIHIRRCVRQRQRSRRCCFVLAPVARCLSRNQLLPLPSRLLRRQCGEESDGNQTRGRGEPHRSSPIERPENQRHRPCTAPSMDAEGSGEITEGREAEGREGQLEDASDGMGTFRAARRRRRGRTGRPADRSARVFCGLRQSACRQPEPHPSLSTHTLTTQYPC